MATVEAVGRDIAAAADSNFDAPVAAAVKSLWAWAGFDQGDNPDHAYAVTATSDADGFTVSAVVTDRNVYVAPGQPDAPATADELARSQVAAAPSDDDGALPAEQPAAAPEAAPAEAPAEAPAAEPAAEAAPAEAPAGDESASGPAA